MSPDQSDTKGKESGPGSIVTMSVSRGGERDSHAESHGKVVQEDVTLEENFGDVVDRMQVSSGNAKDYSLVNGGAMVAFWGWVIMSLITICIAVSLGEIASRYPVAGGVYYWSFMLSPPKIAPLVSWIVGWLSVIGNIIVTLTANFGYYDPAHPGFVSVTAVSRMNLNRADLLGVYYPDYIAANWHTVLCSWALILVLGTISIIGQRYLPHVDTFCFIWIVAGVLATAITLPIKANAGRRSAAEVFTQFVDSGTGWPWGWQFVLGLIQGAYCLSPTGMLASMAEEVVKPELTIPRAIGLLGLVFLLPILFTLGDLTTILGSVTGQPVPEMYLEATGSDGAAFGLFFIVLVNGLVCGLACSQAASRCIWAIPYDQQITPLVRFSRDGGLPGSKFFGRVSQRHEMPLNAFFLCAVVQVVLTCLYFGSSAAFNAFIGVAVICLGSSYLVPILVSLVRGRKEVAQGKFYQGKLGLFCNIVAIAWYIFALPLLSFPTAIPVTETTMNSVFVGFALISLIWYLVWGRTHYRGPPISHVSADI
ncbi:LOW QUALITY PROTEIN: hypothetical protein JCM24511_06037 [Saitozyma sp. JCM 24511]|nr:LOW QUALITY PROTEIN: hypothetical protein JCM24511_06037 [Saitozyma sp. JCM 24511]